MIISDLGYTASNFSRDIDLECHDCLEVNEIGNVKWFPKDQDFLIKLLETEESYAANPFYLASFQSNITQSMRAVLFDWMFEVSSDLYMKRDTTYYAFSYVDRLLSIVQDIKKENYQLVGLTALYIAAKIEEIYPAKIADFASAADNGYSIKSIRQTEKFMLKALNWRITGPSLYTITNWLMDQWDSFLHHNFGHIVYNNPSFYSQMPDSENQRLYEHRYISFKLANHVSYKRFRETMQVLDCSILDINILKYQSKHVSAALLYLSTTEYFRQTQYSLLTFVSPYEEKSQLDSRDMDALVEEMFTSFIAAALDVTTLDEICPAASALYPHFKVEFNNDLPSVCKAQPKHKLEAHYEDFLSYQTHNPKALAFVKDLIKQNR